MILAFGDSLTNGFGVGLESSYPAVMQRKSGVKVINAGVDGELTQEGLKRLPHYLELEPDIVILCHGANDMLNAFSKEQMKDNLVEMIKLIKEIQAKPLLVGVPDYFSNNLVVDDVYKDIALESKVLFEDKVLREIAQNKQFRNDFVHPNERGYEMMADKFIKVLDI